MGIMEKALGEKIHTRQISLSTCPAENNCIIVEGQLKDDRSVDVYIASGEKKPSGTIHHLVLRLLVGPPALTIQDIEVEMLTVPREQCYETEVFMQRLKGLQIQSGFTAKVKALIGGNKGCAHLTTLITSMAQEVIQGYYTYVAQHATGSTSKKHKKGFSTFITDTCYVWRKDGPVMQKLMAQYEKDS